MITLERISKRYGEGERAVTVLDDVSLTVDRGQIAAVVGPSGAGKSTLAKCINLLEAPSSGEVNVDGQRLTGLRGASLRRARHSIGTIFQASSLFQRRTAAENVALPLEYFGVTRRDRDRRVAALLDRVGLADKHGAYPAQLSGGQQQRVGIARALALRPSVLLADEATSGLDPATTRSILDLLRELRDDLGLTVILITHEMEVVREAADQVWRLEHGRIAESGALREVLTDAASPLARELLPERSHAPAASGDRVWHFRYGAEPVPADWLTRISADLGASAGLLGATIESVAGHPVGRAVVSLPAALDSDRVETAIARLGLHVDTSGVDTSRVDVAEAHSFLGPTSDPVTPLASVAVPVTSIEPESELAETAPVERQTA